MRAGTEAARGYAEILEDVNGFALGGGWHGIALGPYTRTDAETALLPYHRDGLIPRVAVIAESSSLRQQFWPVGANILDLEVAPAPIEAETQIVDADETPTAEPTSLVEVELVEPAGETPAEAQRSKGALSREEKKKLQRLLQWAGFYNAAIDGSFGRGTRNSMAAWQEANSYDTAGILTTTQRAEILKNITQSLMAWASRLFAMTLQLSKLSFQRSKLHLRNMSHLLLSISLWMTPARAFYFSASRVIKTHSIVSTTPCRH